MRRPRRRAAVQHSLVTTRRRSELRTNQGETLQSTPRSTAQNIEIPQHAPENAPVTVATVHAATVNDVPVNATVNSNPLNPVTNASVFPTAREIASELLQQMLEKGVASVLPGLQAPSAAASSTAHLNNTAVPTQNINPLGPNITGSALCENQYSGVTRTSTQDHLSQNGQMLTLNHHLPVSTSGPTATLPATIQPPISNVVNTITGDEASSISRPLGTNVDPKIVAKIQNNEFVELGQLLATSSSQDLYQFQIHNGEVSVVPKTKQVQIKSIEHWLQAFHTYVALYVRSHPQHMEGLMKYADIVQTLARRSGFAASMFYDSNFRKWFQVNPSMLWGVINQELYVQALGIGLRAVTKNQPFLGGAPQQAQGNGKKPKGKCWDFLQYGSCARGQQCRFPHTCTKCGGGHHAKQCRNTNTPRSANNSTNTSNNANKQFAQNRDQSNQNK